MHSAKVFLTSINKWIVRQVSEEFILYHIMHLNKIQVTFAQ